MNWGLRCGQILAERADIQRMNIVERTALWYRLERIGQEESCLKDIQPETRGKMYIYLNLDRKALELQTRISLLEEEIKKLRTTHDKKSLRIYKYTL